jgi:hypothetical protein
MKASTKQNQQETSPKSRPARDQKRRIPRLPAVRTDVRAGFSSDPCEGGETKRP